MRLDIAAPGCRSNVRRSTEPHFPQAGQEKLSQGSPAAMAAPILDRTTKPARLPGARSGWQQSSELRQLPYVWPPRALPSLRLGQPLARFPVLGRSDPCPNREDLSSLLGVRLVSEHQPLGCEFAIKTLIFNARYSQGPSKTPHCESACTQ